jgi:hypothetical protein
MKIALNEKQYDLLLSNLPDDQEISEDDSLSSTPSSTPSSSTSSSTTSAPTNNVDAKGVSSSGDKVGYPTVSKWSDIVGSKLTRGPANQIANTKWSDIVGSLISRGAANQLTEERKKLNWWSDNLNKTNEKNYQYFSISGPYEKTENGQIIKFTTNEIKTGEKVNVIFYIKNNGKNPLVIERYYGSQDFERKGGENIIYTKEPILSNKSGILSFTIYGHHKTDNLSYTTIDTYIQTLSKDNDNKSILNTLPYVGLMTPQFPTSTIDPHTWNMMFQFITVFIPIVGPLVSAGIGLYDAKMYLDEGDPKTAGLVAFLSLLPGAGNIVSRIPAVKTLEKKTIDILAKKLSINGSKSILTTTEKEIINGIKENEILVKTEINNSVKKLAEKASQSSKITNATKTFLIKTAKTGIVIGGYYGVAKAYDKIYDHFSETDKNKLSSNYNVTPNAITAATLANRISDENLVDFESKIVPIFKEYALKYDNGNEQNNEKLHKIQIAVCNAYLKNKNNNLNKIATDTDKP